MKSVPRILPLLGVAAAPELPRAAAPDRLQRAMPSVTPPARPTSTEDRLASLLAMARQRLAQEQPEAQAAPLREPESLVGRTALAGRRVQPSIDDDLFEDAPLALDRFAGARRCNPFPASCRSSASPSAASWS